jgi:hypothetical protein
MYVKKAEHKLVVKGTGGLCSSDINLVLPVPAVL